MKKYLGLIIFIGFCFNSMGQWVFKTELSGARSSYSPKHLIQNKDSTFVASGLFENDTTGDYDCFVSKFSAKGDLLWIRGYPMPDVEFNAKAIHGIDSGYLLAATSYSFPTNDFDSTKDILVLKLDNEGDEQWRKVLSGYDYYSSCTCADSSYVILGNRLKKFNSSTPDDDTDYILYKLNKAGKIIWEKQFGTQYGDDPYYSKLYCDKQSNIYFGALNDSATQRFRNGVFYKLNPKGEVVYETFFKEDPSYNFIMGPNQIFTSNSKHFYVRKNGIYEIDLTTGKELYMSEFRSRNKIDARGENISAIYESTLSERNKINFGRLNADFKPYWKNEYKVDYRITAIATVSCLDNGNAFMFREGLKTGSFKMILIKTDCNGNYDHWKECTLGEEEKSIINSELVAYPNPVKNLLFINSKEEGEYRILNLSGKEHFHGNINNGISYIDCSQLENGLYLVQIRTSRSVETRRIIKL